jgi:hypothetical protein
VGGEWDKLYVLEDPERRSAVSLEDYAAWCDENEPFKVHAYKLGRVNAEADMGWVEVQQTVSMRNYPNIPARETQRWEKWRVTDGEWYLVPRPQVDAYPASPVLRDRAAEAIVRERFEQAWAARQAKNWQRLYEFTHPEDREQIDVEALAEVSEKFTMLSYDLRWIEVIGNKGRVYVRYERKLNDPSMTKLPPEWTTITETWQPYDGEWYIKLIK